MSVQMEGQGRTRGNRGRAPGPSPAPLPRHLRMLGSWEAQIPVLLEFCRGCITQIGYVLAIGDQLDLQPLSPLWGLSVKASTL